tara:strand:- start:3178 stop:4374 length:1197 start_codon:yes stop_codon:yes gene_type:complete
MKIYSPKLFIKFDLEEISIIVYDTDELDNFKILEKLIFPIIGFDNKKINDLEKIFEEIKKNILIIENKINYFFKDLIIILNNFNISFLNLSGFKKLNGTQVTKENITYIINSLKYNVDEFENNKKILHIFNSKYSLDKKKIDNIPIGLFGNLYSHELSFNLMNDNDYKNLKSIFDKCNLKIKKILLDSFVKGSLISEKNQDIETFFYVQMDKNYSKIFYVENDSVKFEQSFKFGTEIIVNDIVKITKLKPEIIKKILENYITDKKFLDSPYIKKEYFENQQYRKIKKELIFNIAEARIKELSEILFIKNINFAGSINCVKVIFLEFINSQEYNFFKDLYSDQFSNRLKLITKFIECPKIDEEVVQAIKIDQFGWKKEAIPVTVNKKSYIGRILQKIFS